LIYSCGYQGGITVRYNADGSIMTKGDLKWHTEIRYVQWTTKS
jgi:hypothetical protein